MYTKSLHGETIYEYKLFGLFGFNLPRPMGARGMVWGPLFPMVHGKLEPYDPWTLYSLVLSMNRV